MSYNLSNLKTFVDENKLGVIKASIFETPVTMQNANMITGVKGSIALNIVSDEISVVSATSNWAPTGATTYGQRILEVKPLEVQKEFTNTELLPYWMGYQVRVSKAGDTSATIPFEEEITDILVANVAEKVEDMLWNETSLMKGLLYFIESGSTELDYSGITGVYDTIAYTLQHIPTKVRSKATILVGQDIFDAYVQALVVKNMFHYNPVDDANGFLVPGSSKVKIMPVPGLDDKERIVAMDWKNAYIGTDEASDMVNIESDYDFKSKSVLFRISFNLGTQIGIPSEIVWGQF